ncbi:MAG TPA: hypothetical protein VMV14_00545 [Acidimicrobiales bacterium]|nr:hypothetical protein [Acidimicrobiales bacterium]
MLSNLDVEVKGTASVRRLMRMVLRALVRAAVVAAVVAGVRSLLGRLSGEPGTASFDAWPPVPQAPRPPSG